MAPNIDLFYFYSMFLVTNDKMVPGEFKQTRYFIMDMR